MRLVKDLVPRLQNVSRLSAETCSCVYLVLFSCSSGGHSKAQRVLHSGRAVCHPCLVGRLVQHVVTAVLQIVMFSAFLDCLVVFIYFLFPLEAHVVFSCTHGRA